MKKKDQIKYKNREDKAYLKGRMYDFFEKYIKEHLFASVVEMDTVYNDVSNGPFIQTFMIVSFCVMVAVYDTTKTTDTMVSGLCYIKILLGDELFHSIFGVLVTDYAEENTIPKFSNITLKYYI